MAKKNLTEHTKAAHAAIVAAGLAGTSEVRRHLVNLENLGIDTKDADIALDTHEKLVKDDPDDVEAHAESFDQLADAVLNLPADEVEVPDETDEPVPVVVAESVPGADDAPAKAGRAPRAPVANKTNEHLHSKGLETYSSVLGPEKAKLIFVGFEPTDFAEGGPLGEPPLQEGLNYLPPPKVGDWDPYSPSTPGCRPYPEVYSMEGYDYYTKVMKHFGLVGVHTGNNQRIHMLELNPNKLGWASFYAGTAKRNILLKTIFRNMRMVEEATAPAIPDITKPDPADKPARAPRGSKGSDAPIVPPVPEGPPVEWSWNEETFTGVADNRFQAELTMTGAHVFALWSFLPDAENKPETAEGKIRLKANTREKGREEVEKRYARGEFNG